MPAIKKITVLMPLTLEDLIWQRSFDQGQRLEAMSPATPQWVIMELARDGGALQFISELGGSPIKALDLLFTVVGFAAEDCTVRDASYFPVEEEEPLAWATHARVNALGW